MQTPDSASLVNRPIDPRPEFQWAFRRGLLAGTLAMLVGLAVVVAAVAGGAMHPLDGGPLVLLALPALLTLVHFSSMWFLLERRLFPAWRAAEWLIEASNAKRLALFGAPVPSSAQEVQERLADRQDEDAVAARASSLTFEGHAAEARGELAAWHPVDPERVAGRARIEAGLALMDGHSEALGRAEAAARDIPDPERRAVALALVAEVGAQAASREGGNPVPFLARAAEYLGQRAKAGSPELERGIHRIRFVMAALALALPLFAAAVLLIAQTRG